MTDDYRPREEVIEFLRRGLERKAEESSLLFDDSMLKEIRAGTPRGRELYDNVLAVYTHNYGVR